MSKRKKDYTRIALEPGQGAKVGDVVERDGHKVVVKSVAGVLVADFPKADPRTYVLAKNQEQLERESLDNLTYLRANIHKPAYAIARRQGFGRLLEYANELGTAGTAALKEADAYRALATALYGSATGRFTAEQITGHPALNDSQKKDCLMLIQQREDALKYHDLAK